MSARPLALAGLLGAAAGGPYVLSQAPTDWASSPWGPSPQQTEAAAPAPDPMAELAMRPPNLAEPQGPESNLYRNPASLIGPTGLSLEQALRWDVTKNWVYRNWARKSTGLSDPQLFGVRVPLVTGNGMTDVAGSLTYYFDRQGALQRMRLRGRTADTSRLVHLSATSFGMRQVASTAPGEQLYQAYQDEKLRSELRTRPEGVLWGDSPHGSFDVFFEVTRPGGPFAVQPFVAPFSAPDDSPTEAANPFQPVAADPVFPPNSVVPEGAAAGQSAAAQTPAPTGAEANAAAQPQGGPPVPTLPEVGSPTAAPPPEVKNLNGYRDRFRWPG